MATDKRLDQVSTLTDFDYALIVKGDQVAKASKQQLAELVGDLLYGATNASSLATVVARLLGKSYAADMNDCITNGESGMVSTSTLNLPDTFSDTGVYHVVRAKYNVNDNLFIAQTIYGDDGSVYKRECWNNTWRSWQRTDNFGYNTLEDLSSAVAGYLPFVSDMAYGVYNLSEMDSKTKEGVYVLADVPLEEYGCVFVFAAKTHFIFQILLSANKAKFRRCNYGQTFDGIEWVVLN